MPLPNRRTWLSSHIDEELDLLVGEHCFPIRVTEIEEASGPKCDCSYELVGDSTSVGKSDGTDDEEEWRHASIMRDSVHGSVSNETMVPNSIMSSKMNGVEMDKMWEGNMRVVWQVLESESGMAEENIGLIQRDEEMRCCTVDLLTECEVRNEGQQSTIAANEMCSPTESGS
ncbi:hypothetical protein V6N13_007956 [Hibiscus sabdariffa]